MKNNSIPGHVGTAALGCPGECSSTGFVAGNGVHPLESVRWFTTRLKLACQILIGTLREIFDESAYARFLKQRQLTSSRAAYAAFRQENEVTKARRPRCC
jgi:hypothetical protein